jgi:hypothetical protein
MDLTVAEKEQLYYGNAMQLLTPNAP